MENEKQPTQVPVSRLENGQESKVQPVIASKPKSMEEKLDLLLTFLATKEARIAEDEQSKEVARLARNVQREKSSAANVEKELLKQARCRHLKGGKLGPLGGVPNYNVTMHTFIDNKTIGKCNNCRMRWMPGDTQEFLFRVDSKGVKRKIANHTKQGWGEFQAMFTQSTNTPTSSEVPLQAVSAVASADVLSDVQI
jgi:hypothetical protein